MDCRKKFLLQKQRVAIGVGDVFFCEFVAVPLKVLDYCTGDTTDSAMTQKRFKIFMFLLRSGADKDDIYQIDAAKKYKNKSFPSRALAVTGF